MEKITTTIEESHNLCRRCKARPGCLDKTRMAKWHGCSKWAGVLLKAAKEVFPLTHARESWLIRNLRPFQPWFRQSRPNYATTPKTTTLIRYYCRRASLEIWYEASQFRSTRMIWIFFLTVKIWSNKITKCLCLACLTGSERWKPREIRVEMAQIWILSLWGLISLQMEKVRQNKANYAAIVYLRVELIGALWVESVSTFQVKLLWIDIRWTRTIESQFRELIAFPTSTT